MFKSKSLVLAAVFGTALALPVAAVEIPADVTLGATPEDTTMLKAVEDSAFVGNEVKTKDQVVIGQVESIWEGANGPFMVVALNSDYAAKSSVKSFAVPIAADTAADGSVTLGWNESDLFTTLSGNLEPITN
jgi:hypothetical protein